MTSAPVNLVARIEPEDRMRADFYALLARLFFARPDAELLRMMGNAPLLETDADGEANDAPLAIAWARLSAAARVMDVDAAADEYDALFGGIGHSEISLFASNYVGDPPGTGATAFIVDLRAALAGLGIGLQSGQTLPEDHIAALLEAMRLLIAGSDSVPARDLVAQQQFFQRFIAPWQARCCTAIDLSRLANFYRTVAECTDAFLAMEKSAFEIA